MRPWTAPSGRSGSPPRGREARWFARAPATTPLRTPDRPPRTVPPGNVAHSVAPHARVSPAAVVEPLSALADRDVLGPACRRNHVRPVLAVRLATAPRIAAVPALGRADERSVGFGGQPIMAASCLSGGLADERLNSVILRLCGPTPNSCLACGGSRPRPCVPFWIGA